MTEINVKKFLEADAVVNQTIELMHRIVIKHYTENHSIRISVDEGFIRKFSCGLQQKFEDEFFEEDLYFKVEFYKNSDFWQYGVTCPKLNREFVHPSANLKFEKSIEVTFVVTDDPEKCLVKEIYF